MKYTRTQYSQLLEEGWYKAAILGIKEGKDVNTMFGACPTVRITFKTDEKHNVTHSFLMGEGMNTLLENLINVTFGPGEGEMDLADLIGLRCGIRLEHNHGGDRVYANVVEVCRDEELEENEVQDDEFQGA